MTEIIRLYVKTEKKNITKIDTFYLSSFYNFGNNLIAINNCIFYCEILGCHNIILDKFHKNFLINETIFLKESKITIRKDSNIKCNNDNIICLNEQSWYIFYPVIVLPEIRIHLLKNEILKNLPDVKIESDSLYIHIRGGNIFLDKPHSVYAQPPFCFYDKILYNNKFQNIYIISMDKQNIIISCSTNKYNNIIFNKSSLKYDISLLVHAYNIVLSASTFALSSIKLNDNLKDLWEYDIIHLYQKIRFLHHQFYKFKINYRIHRVKPSDTYISKMYS